MRGPRSWTQDLLDRGACFMQVDQGSIEAQGLEQVLEEVQPTATIEGMLPILHLLL